MPRHFHFFIYSCWIYQVILFSLKVFWKEWISFRFKFLIIISCLKGSAVIVRDLVTFDLLGIPKFSLVLVLKRCVNIYGFFSVYFENKNVEALLMRTYQSVGGAVQNCTKNKIKPKDSVDSVETTIGFYLIKWNWKNTFLINVGRRYKAKTELASILFTAFSLGINPRFYQLPLNWLTTSWLAEWPNDRVLIETLIVAQLTKFLRLYAVWRFIGVITTALYLTLS